jgi:hypothetical protein
MDMTKTATEFETFNEQNPHVLDRLIGLARKQQAAGQTRLGMKMLFEVLRYEESLYTIGNAFKMNNSFAPYYARLVQSVDPALGGLFETRKMRTA